MRRVILRSDSIPDGVASIVDWADAVDYLRETAEAQGTPKPHLDREAWRKQAANRAMVCYGQEHAWATDVEFLADGIRLGLVLGHFIN
jgi:hypothetical protein